MKLSIIIPCYNIENFIGKCLESLINQKRVNDIEILIINDGSIDNTEKEIKKYLNKNINIKYFFKENEGLSKTRNLGLKKSIGEYVMFLDGDDYLEKEFLDIILPLLNENIDVINIAHRQVLLNKANEIEKELKNFSINKERLELKDFIFNSFLTSACTKIVKKDILLRNEIFFSEERWYEDVNFVLKLITKSLFILNIKKPLYNYVQRESSITKTYTEKIRDIFYIIDDTLDFFNKNNILINNQTKKYLIFEYCINHNYSRIVRTESKIKQFLLIETINYLKNKNIEMKIFKYLNLDLKYLNGVLGRVYFKSLSILKKGI